MNNKGVEIKKLARKKLVERLYAVASIEGNIGLAKFLSRTWLLEKMPSTDYRYGNAYDDIHMHMDVNDDWNLDYLYDEHLDLYGGGDAIFLRFLENAVDPNIRENLAEQARYIEIINEHLSHEALELRIYSQLYGYDFYKVVRRGDLEVEDAVNLVFGTKYKPEFLIEDVISGKVRVGKNADQCLVYEKTIPSTGLYWQEALSWWISSDYSNSASNNHETDLLDRLWESLDSDAEKTLLETYYNSFREKLGERLPFLIPQVYLHWDPKTQKELSERRLERQKMDFLLLLSDRRIVIEVDGIHHYADIKSNIAKPKRYSEMVAEDRRLKLTGYEVFRFGGFELTQGNGERIVREFFTNLFEQYGIPI